MRLETHAAGEDDHCEHKGGHVCGLVESEGMIKLKPAALRPKTPTLNFKGAHAEANSSHVEAMAPMFKLRAVMTLKVPMLKLQTAIAPLKTAVSKLKAAMLKLKTAVVKAKAPILTLTLPHVVRLGRDPLRVSGGDA